LGDSEKPVTISEQQSLERFLQTILDDNNVKLRSRVMLALLASTGMRVGELQALQLGPDPLDQNTLWDSNAKMIRVRKSIYRGQLQEPKTQASVRDIDLPSPANQMLQEFAIGKQQGEFLFCTKSGKPLAQSHITTYILRPLGIPGCHALRRFRVSHLREVGCNEDILKSWLGHSTGSDITSRYSKLSENLELRRTWAERVGTGLDLSSITGAPPPTNANAKPRKPESAAYRIEPVVMEPTYNATDDDLSDFFSTPVIVAEEA
jgi:integrase